MQIITLSDIKLPLGKGEDALIALAQKKLGKKPAYFRIRKKSLDARDKENIKYIYSIEFSSTPQPTIQPEIERLPKSKLPTSPVLVVGGGPAGLFCALQLLKRGVAPILIERGAPVEERERTIEKFCETKKLDTETNVQFGEGGAGTFSDGKLNTQTHSPLNEEVLKTFVQFGAPEEILWLNKPHIGSDNLKTVVKNMRTYLLQNGAQVLFYTRLDDIVLQGNKVVGATLTNTRTRTTETLDVSALVLAVGHSARDTFEKLLSRGVCMRQKDFAVGVRIEHLQSAIGLAQYGKAYTKLPAADYKLVSHASERATFTFCMCPGGYVMPAASEEGGVVTNGMSNFARNGLNANSALIAQVSRADFDDDSPLAGVRFQQKIERAAYKVGGGNYAAPVQRVEDFLRGKTSQAFGEVLPTYGAGTTFADLHAVLPLGITQALKDSLLDMDKKLRGFAHPDALLTGAETRTSSPLRIERDKDSLQSVSTANLYPCGEGAGYAGGITSSAADGIRVANAVYASFL
jgi:uncharacterized FAD-dependent dehydrogenase